MTVCPGTWHALETLAAHQNVPVGVHLTLTGDFPAWTWAALTTGATIQRDGLLLPIQERDRLLAQARTEDVAAEFRAQLERVLQAGLRPTHLDWHCLADGGREDIFDLTMALADEYGIGIRAWTDYGRRRLRACDRVAQDHPFLDSFAIPTEGKIEHLLKQVRDLPPGLSEWAIHPAAPNADDPGSEVRSTDRAALLAPSLLQALSEEQIEVVGYGRSQVAGR